MSNTQNQNSEAIEVSQEIVVAMRESATRMVLEILEFHEGFSLDNPENREAIASAIAQRFQIVIIEAMRRLILKD